MSGGLADSVATRFAEAFRRWRIELPAADVVARRAGFIAEQGWLIQYCFGRDEVGEYLDYYAAHRMTNDSHERIYETGEVVGLPALYDMRLCSDDPDEDRRLEQEYMRHNREVAQTLFEKGFDRFTMNMALHAGFDGSDEVGGDDMLKDNSVNLVPPQGDAKGFDKTYQEKWLIYCPAIANDTLLYMITAGESYSIRSYGGHLRVNTTPRHAAGVHTTSEFMAKFDPDRPYELTALGLAVDKGPELAEFIERKWKLYRERHGLV